MASGAESGQALPKGKHRGLGHQLIHTELTHRIRDPPPTARRDRTRWVGSKVETSRRTGHVVLRSRARGKPVPFRLEAFAPPGWDGLDSSVFLSEETKLPGSWRKRWFFGSLEKGLSLAKR